MIETRVSSMTASFKPNCLPSVQYELYNLKIYEINKHDSYMTRYDLKTTNGKCKLDPNRTHIALIDANSDFVYMNVALDRLDFERMRIENNKLVFHLHNTGKIVYGVESRHFTDLKKLVYDLKSVVSARGNRSNGVVHINSLELCELFQEAVHYGDVDKACFYATQLAKAKARLSVKLAVDSDSTMLDCCTTDHESTVDSDQTQTDPFNIRCIVIKDENDNKDIYLENLSLTMTINDLKYKVFAEYQIPVGLQVWIINNTSCESDKRIKDYTVPGKNCFNLYVFNSTNCDSNTDRMETDDQSSTSETSWSCKTCTFANKSTHYICATCDEPRLQDLSGRRDDLSETVTANNVSDSQAGSNVEMLAVWTCNTCTFINQCTDKTCAACGQEPDPNATTEFNASSDSVEFLAVTSTNSTMSDHWQYKCQVCTFINIDSDDNCKICGETIPHRYRKNASAEILSDYLAAYTNEITENTLPFACDICMDDQVDVAKGVVLKECLHLFCKECLRQHILHSDDSVVSCPFSKDFVCHSNILEREIRALLDPNEYMKFQVKCLKEGEAKIANTFHCKTPDCIGFCICEDNLNFFYCPVCEQTNCIKCNCIHMGKTCVEYNDDLKIKLVNSKASEQDKEALEKMVNDGIAMNCPGCKIIVLKDVGCDWLVCLVCKMEICWATKGPRWGRGDTSGGCKCNFTKKKCTPKCQNCH